ncbi:MAG: sigma-54 dependent transcriptional regulator [Candidatus Zixiibacteriota bacterium]
MKTANILIVDDDSAVRSSLGLMLKQAGYKVTSADSPESALHALKSTTPDLFIIDMNFSMQTSGEEGLELLGNLKSLCPDRPVILMTAWGTIPLAVEGMKIGAVDFITKPWNNERFLQSIRTALSLSSRYDTGDKRILTREELNKRYNFDNIIGVNTELITVLEMAGRVSATDAAVLIMGESGTGKELIAEAIHVNSERRNGPFIKVNLGSIPSTLFESEMFGHKRGSFTNAMYDRVGRFKMADGGTIFLDEIGDLDAASQVKLLRVLQDRSFEVLGSSENLTADFRLITATNRELEEMVKNGRFREDLYYRINLIILRLPPLRQRKEDIPLLVNYFINNLKVIYGRDNLSVTDSAVNWLSDLAWPGNIRELKNVVERTVLVNSRDRLDYPDFKAQLDLPPKAVNSGDLPAVGTITLEEMERSMIQKAAEFHGNNISKIARSLGLSRAALYRRLEKYGISL